MRTPAAPAEAYTGLAFAPHVPGCLISAIRWRLLLLTQRIRIPLRLLLDSYLVGTFFHQRLPTTVGGDVVRVYDTTRYSRAPEASLPAVVIERLTGILALAVLALVGLFISVQRIAGVRLTGIVVLMLGLTFLPLWLVWSPRRSEPVLRWLRRLGGGRLEALVRAGGAGARALRRGERAAWSWSSPSPFSSRPRWSRWPPSSSILPVPINGGGRVRPLLLGVRRPGVPVSGTAAWLGFAMVLVYAAVGGLLYALRR